MDLIISTSSGYAKYQSNTKSGNFKWSCWVNIMLTTTFVFTFNSVLITKTIKIEKLIDCLAMKNVK